MAAGGIHATRVAAGGSVGQGGQHGTLLAASEGAEPLPRQASAPHVWVNLRNQVSQAGS